MNLVFDNYETIASSLITLLKHVKSMKLLFMLKVELNRNETIYLYLPYWLHTDLT